MVSSIPIQGNPQETEAIYFCRSIIGFCFLGVTLYIDCTHINGFKYSYLLFAWCLMVSNIYSYGNQTWAVVSILLYGCTTWTLTKWLKKKLDGNYTRMLRAILNKSWPQHPTRHQLYDHLPPITKTIQVRRTRHAGHCWRSKHELISDVPLLTPAYGQAKARRPARTYIQKLRKDTGCSPEDLPEAMNDWEKWRERVRDIRASGTTWWWWLVVHSLMGTSTPIYCMYAI